MGLSESGRYPRFFRCLRSRRKDLLEVATVNWTRSFLNFSCLIDPFMPTEMRWLLSVSMLLPWPLDPETKVFVFGILQRVLISPLVISADDTGSKLCTPDQVLTNCASSFLFEKLPCYTSSYSEQSRSEIKAFTVSIRSSLATSTWFLQRRNHQTRRRRRGAWLLPDCWLLQRRRHRQRTRRREASSIKRLGAPFSFAVGKHQLPSRYRKRLLIYQKWGADHHHHHHENECNGFFASWCHILCHHGHHHPMHQPQWPHFCSSSFRLDLRPCLLSTEPWEAASKRTWRSRTQAMADSWQPSSHGWISGNLFSTTANREFLDSYRVSQQVLDQKF